MSLKKVFHTAIRVSSWSHAVAIGSIALILSACTDYVDKYEGDYKDDYGDRETFIQNLNSANLDLASVCSSGDWFWCASQDGAYTTSNDGKIETYSSGDVRFTFTGTDDNAYKYSTNELDNDLLPYLRRNGGISVSVEGSGEWDAGLRINTGNYFDLLHEKNVVVAYENSCPGVKINLDVVTAKDYMERGSLVKEGTVLYRYSGELPTGGFQVLTVDPDQLTNEIGDSKWRTAEFSISATENRDRYTSEITIEFTESCPEFKDGKGLNLVGIGLQSTTRSNSGTVKSSSSSGEGDPGNNGGSTVKSSSSLAKSSSSSVKSSSSSANTFWTVTCKGTPNAGTITWEPQFYYVSALEQATAKYSWTLNGALDSETNTAIKPTVTYLADGEYFAQLSVTVNGQTKTTKCSALIESGASGFLWKGSDKLDLVQTDFGSGSKWYFGTDQEGGGSTTIQFPEINPYDECEGKCGMVWFGNTEYPYATVGFNLDENGTTYDVSAWKGLCIAYYSPEKMYLKLDLQNISDYGSDLPAAELPSLSSMDEYRVENIEWASFKQGGWGNASTISGEEAARILKGVVVTFAGSTGGSQFFNIYQIGSYGKCGNVQPKNVDMSQFRQTSAWDYLNPNISYGEISDSRDGQVYKTIDVGNYTWFAQNLNLEYNDGEGNSCPGSDPDSCAKYGRMYTWAAAMDTAGVYSTQALECGAGKVCWLIDPVQGVCPEGWHLPSNAEWRLLVEAAGGESTAAVALKSTKGWVWNSSNTSGTDDLGFSAIPNGPGEYGYFWSGTENSNISGYRLRLMGDATPSTHLGDGTKSTAMNAVRCVKEKNPKPRSGSFTYQGQTYNYVRIGTQTWMAENLNYDIGNNMCYKNDPANCTAYGRMYKWATVVGKTEAECGYGNSCDLPSTGHVQGICPEGWHVPRRAEVETLVEAAGGDDFAGKALKATSTWSYSENNGKVYGNGTDATGFTGYSTGTCSGSSSEPSCNYDGMYTHMWTITENYSGEQAYYFGLLWMGNGVTLLNGDKRDYKNLRCVQDED
ncbi:major paralogous domain-containing protein [Fibrobacter sp. UWCM]|uniref:FISUMP domain-containing protein n=1 Tax=Fibrobacter sp. UWCM TaxID=1896208 RepID=UPI0009207807|nr:FISUMP domain-containing protein [Fibrobacter sp. UWCM]SHG73150.1 major paralogous domain-containing protein [Fibrobacter sp. UWCM]